MLIYRELYHFVALRFIFAQWWLRMCAGEVDDRNLSEEARHFTASLGANCQYIMFTRQPALCCLLYRQWLLSVLISVKFENVLLIKYSYFLPMISCTRINRAVVHTVIVFMSSACMTH